ncbi:MAG: NAD(+)/NADH kinase [Bacteroidales bacterium]|nr:NAD(+)/NADH kinase [Bacteroidales bacterium]
MKIALYNRDRQAGVETVKRRLREKGATPVCYGEDFTSWQDLPADTSLFLSLGGDGTFLQSLTFVRDRGIPVAGINFGHLGFLTTARADEDDWVDALLSGRYSVEERSLIRVTCAAFPETFYPFALNEVSLQRRGASMLQISVRINGRELPTYWADGLVIATPTGSTAYNLSVGGPVVMPDSEVMVIAPIAPHNLNVRPLVVPMDAAVELSFRSREEGAVLTLDNRSCEIPSDTAVTLARGHYGLRYVTLSDDNFIHALQTKLFWGEDRRNANR